MVRVVRALRSRPALAATSFVVATVAVAAAVLGPTYADTATRALLSSRLTQTPPFELGLSRTLRFPGHAPMDIDRVVATARRLSHREDGGAFRPAVIGLELGRYDGSRVGATRNASVLLEWREGYCQRLRIRGRCPTGNHEGLLSRVDSLRSGATIGDSVVVRPASPESVWPPWRASSPVRVRIVGIYQVPHPRQPYWFDPGLLHSVPASSDQLKPLPYRPAPVFVPAALFGSVAPRAWQVRIDRTFRPTDDPDVVAASAAIVTRATRSGTVQVARGELSPAGFNALVAVDRRIQAEQRVLNATCLPAAGALVALTILLLYLLLSGSAGQRRSEMALAKLRGLSRRKVLAFGMAEPVAILVPAAVVGVAVGWLASVACSQAWLGGHHTQGPPTLAWLAVAGTVVAGLLAALAAVRQVLREPLATQLRDSSGRARLSLGAVVVRALVVGLALAAVTQVVTQAGRQGGSRLGLTAPVFVALAVAVLAGPVTRTVGSYLANITGWGRGTAVFLAARRLTRRSAGAVTAPILVAVALSAFSASTWAVAADWRVSQARASVGADRVYSSPFGPWRTIAVTRSADPRGRWLMAGVYLQNTGAGSSSLAPAPNRIFVDTSRFARVAAWDSSWGEPSAAAARRLLRPRPVVPPVVLRGSRVGVDVTTRVHSEDAVFVDLLVRDRHETTHEVALGPLRGGRQLVSGALPGCAAGCRVERLGLSTTAGVPLIARGTATWHRLLVDGRPVDSGLQSPASGRWRAYAFDDVAYVRILHHHSGEGVAVKVNTRGGPQIPAITPADVPRARPVLTAGHPLGPAASSGGPVVMSGIDGADLTVLPTRVRALPVVGSDGVLGDLQMALREALALPPGARVRVFARADTPQSVLAALRDTGVHTAHPVSMSGELAALDSDAYPLGLRLYLLVAIVGVVLALAGTGAVLGVQTRVRSREAAALRVLAVKPRRLAGSELLEQMVRVGIAVVLGVLAGAGIELLVLPAIRLGELVSAPPPVDVGVHWALLGAVGGACLVGCLGLAALVGGLVVARAKPRRLRETEG